MTIGVKVNDPSSTGSFGSTSTHVAGSIVYGKVYLSVKGREEEANSVRLKVIGKENVMVHHTSTENEQNGNGNHARARSSPSSHSSVTRDHYERSTHDVWHVDHPLKVFPNGKVSHGQYEFPFALQLPTNLPSTMSSQSGQSICEVRYEVVAEVFKKPNSILYSNPNAKEEINVVAMHKINHDTSLHLPADIVPINKCCCFTCTKQGTIALETKFDRTTLLVDPSGKTAASYRNENRTTDQNGVMVEFRCQNKSTAKVGSVDVQLIEVIEWTSNGHKESVRSVLAEAKKDAQLYPELDALWRKPNRFDQRRDDNNEAHSLLQYKPWNAIGPLLVQTHANDTYRGKGIHVRHILEIQLKTMGWCATNPDVSTMIEIYRNSISPSSSSSSTAPSTGRHEVTAPSAPFEDEFSSTIMTQQASAPSGIFDYDDSPYGCNNEKMTNNDNGFTSMPTAEAKQVLPEDWNAQTAEVVTIPMVEATILTQN